MKTQAVMHIVAHDLAQTTTARKVTIYYPFHPRSGGTFPVLQSRTDDPPVHVIEAGTSAMWIPQWMTERHAADFELSNLPVIDVAALRRISRLALTFLSNVDGSLVPSASRDEDGEHDQSNPSTIPDRANRERSSSSRAVREERERYGATPASGSRGRSGDGGDRR